MLLVAAGALAPDPVTSIDLAIEAVKPEAGHAYVIDRLPLAPLPALAGDDSEAGNRSTIGLLENGKSLGPAHSSHEDIRRAGEGRFSHWGEGLYFSASDNTDPRTNGRAYAVRYAKPLPAPLRWALIVAGSVLLALSQARSLARELGEIVTRLRQARRSSSVDAAGLPLLPAGIFLAVAAVVVMAGADRSAWILITQPFEALHGSNSLLGYSYVHGSGLLHKENLSSFLQVAFYSGYEVVPDLYFRRPVYSYLAALVAPLAGIEAAFLAVNLAAWAAAVWLCHRFTQCFYGDPRAARWAAALAATGMGFVVHALDYSAHLLAFTVYFGGVVLVYEGRVWRERADGRTHAIIGVYLALACLQYNTGIALVAAYLLVAFRHNRLRFVLPAALAALAAQPAWDALVAEVTRLHAGLAPADLSLTEREYFGRALEGWRQVLSQPLDAMVPQMASIAGSFLTFEAPLVVLVGVAWLLADALRCPEGRERAAFAAPFILLPVGAAMVFATAAGARGYLVYGASLFFFASCGAALSRLHAKSRSAFVAGAAAMLVLSAAWSLAHHANVLGPAKAYFLGVANLPVELFVPGSWEALSLTGAEPTPRMFGGAGGLDAAGLSLDLPRASSPPYRGMPQALLAGALLAGLASLLFALAARAGWRTTMLVACALLAIPTVAGRSLPGFPRVSVPERVIEVAQPLAYAIDLSEEVRRRFRADLSEGRAVVLFAWHYNGEAPEVRLGGHPVRLDRKVAAPDWIVNARLPETGSWVANAGDLRRALEAAKNGRLEIGFAGGAGVHLGGWQRQGLPGRAVEGSAARAAPIVPAVELRIYRGDERGAPVFFAF